MKMLSPALSVLRHAPRASSVLCGCSPGLQTPSLHLHPQDHLPRLLLSPRQLDGPTSPASSILDPRPSSSSSLASSPVVGLAEPGRRPSCCSPTSAPASFWSQPPGALLACALDFRRPPRVLPAPPPAPGAARRSGGSSSSEGDSAVAVGAVGCCVLCRLQSQNAPPARRWVDRRQSDEGKRSGIVLHGRRSVPAAAGADLDPPYCRASLSCCRCCSSRRRRRRCSLGPW